MTEQTKRYERVRAEDVEVGDKIARARTHEFHTIASKRVTAVAVRFTVEQGWDIRPNRDALLWREMPED